jgi:predicted RNA-binding Zn ribbon-like protein
VVTGRRASPGDARRSDEDLPLLGEPLPLEFANSLYGAGDERIDFLDTTAAVRRWFQHPRLVSAPKLPTQIRRAHAGAIRELRDVVRHILRAALDGETPAPELVIALNQAAARAPLTARLSWDSNGPGASTRAKGPLLDVLLGTIATETIALLSGPDRCLLRACTGPGCTLLFLQNHHRRRFCHPSCGHRDRQARYYRRTLTHDRRS